LAKVRLAVSSGFNAHAGWQGGATNQLIHNLQKKRGAGGYQYKAPAIAECARTLSDVINADWLANSCLISIPPSTAERSSLTSTLPPRCIALTTRLSETAPLGSKPFLTVDIACVTLWKIFAP
jgi:hypothetical protein